MKRKLSIIIALVILCNLSVGVVSFAEEVPSKSILEDFGDGSYEAPGYQESFGQANRVKGIQIPQYKDDGTYASITFPGGIFGKPDGDKVFKFEQMVVSNDLTKDLDGHEYKPEIKRDPYIEYNTREVTGNLNELAGKDYVIHLTAEFAYENFQKNQLTRMQTIFYHNDPNITKKNVNFQFFNFQNGEFTMLGGQEVTDSEGNPINFIDPLKWYKFDMLVYSDLSMEAYINGEKVNVEGQREDGKYYDAFNFNPEHLDRINALRISTNPVKANNYYPITRIYADNLGASISPQAPVIKPYNGYDTSKVKLDMSDVVQEGSAPSHSSLTNFRGPIMGVVKYQPTAGRFGKPATDTIYEMSNTSETMPEGTGADEHLRWVRNPLLALENIDVLIGRGELLPGEKIRIGFDLSPKALLTRKYIQTKFNDINQNRNIFSFEPNGSIKLFGEDVASVHPETDKWYRFDIVLTSGDEDGDSPNTADLYINGILVKEGLEFNAGNDSNYERLKSTKENLRIGYNFQGLSLEGNH